MRSRGSRRLILVAMIFAVTRTVLYVMAGVLAVTYVVAHVAMPRGKAA